MISRGGRTKIFILGVGLKKHHKFLAINHQLIIYMIDPWEKKSFLGNMVAATVTAFAVSPTNAILDRSVIEFANGKQPVVEGVKGGLRRLFTSPL